MQFDCTKLKMVQNKAHNSELISISNMAVLG